MRILPHGTRLQAVPLKSEEAGLAVRLPFTSFAENACYFLLS